jgi:sarcosine oxidase subunit delta
MLLIPCPWCGERAETEFHCGGEAHIVRPREPATLSDDQSADYLFMRSNPKGVHCERWRHLHGCGRWFNLARDTIGDRILKVYLMGERRPKVAAPKAADHTGARPELAVVTSTPEEPA